MLVSEDLWAHAEDFSECAMMALPHVGWYFLISLKDSRLNVEFGDYLIAILSLPLIFLLLKSISDMWIYVFLIVPNIQMLKSTTFQMFQIIQRINNKLYISLPLR